MRKTLLALAVLAMGIAATTQATTLYLGDGSTSDISGAFSSGAQNWDTTTANWTTAKNPAAYQAYANGSDAIFLGDLPTITVTENITVNNIGRETQVDANGNRMDINIGAGNTLTINGTMDGQPHGLDLTIRQFNFNGPGNLAGTFAITNSSRVLLNNGLTISPGTEITWKGGSLNQFRFQSGMAGADLSNLTLILEDTPQIDNNSKAAITLGSVIGTGVMDLGTAAGNLILKNTEIGGVNAIGTLTQTLGDGSLSLTNGTHTFDIDGDTLSADKLTLTSGTLTLGGTLTVNLSAGTLGTGDIFQLLVAPSFAGSFSTINLPSLTSPLFWDTSNLGVNGSILVSGETVTNYSGTIYLGNGTDSYTDSPATWDTTSALWGLGPNVDFSAWTNWIDGSDAIFKGSGSTRSVNLAAGLDILVDELVWDAPAESIAFVGDGSQTITVTNQIRTALSQIARQVTLKDVNLGGSFTLANISRLSIELGTAVLPDTEILATDGSDIQFNGTTTDFSDLSLTLGAAGGSIVFNQSASDKTIGFLGGTGEIRVGTNTVALTVNNVTVGGISNVSSIVANSLSTGNLVLGGGTHEFSINPEATTSDLLGIGAGTMTLGGDLVVMAVNTNKVALGDTFNLLDASTILGSFNSVTLPSNVLPAGLVWHNNLETDGTISVGTPGIAYETINFTDFLNQSTWGDNSSGATALSGSITNGQGTIFTLTVSNVSDTPTAPIWLYTTAIAGIKGANGNTRLDSFDATPGVVNTSNDEALRFELSISGTAVDSLGLKSLLLDSFAVGEIAELSDGTTSTQFLKTVASEGVVSYDDVMAGLTELTEANVGTWKLDIASRDNNNATLNTLSIDEVQFLVSYQFASDFEIWAEGFGLTGSDAAPDFDYEPDGMDNLTEYAIGGDPTIDDASTVLPESGIAEDAGTNWLYYVHNERTDDASLTFTVQLKEDLVYDPAWVTTGVEFVGESGIVADFKSVTNRTDLGSNEEFLRLLIEQN